MNVMGKNEPLRFYVNRSLAKNGYELFGFMQAQGGTPVSQVSPLCICPMAEGAYSPPMALLSQEEATELMNDYGAGVAAV